MALLADARRARHRVPGVRVYESARGRSLAGGFGIYQEVGQANYSFSAVWHWVVYHWGDLSFAVALLPLSALIVLFGLACRRATRPRPPSAPSSRSPRRLSS